MLNPKSHRSEKQRLLSLFLQAVDQLKQTTQEYVRQAETAVDGTSLLSIQKMVAEQQREVLSAYGRYRSQPWESNTVVVFRQIFALEATINGGVRMNPCLPDWLARDVD